MIQHDNAKTDELCSIRSQELCPPAAIKRIDLAETSFSFKLPKSFAGTEGVALIDLPAARERLADLREKFENQTGAKLVFAKEELAVGQAAYFDQLPTLALERQIAAAEIALREVSKYPPGFMAQIGLKTFGIFEACISNSNDGFHSYDSRYGGYRYYGVYNTSNGAVAAYYSDEQLPLTIHHETFHAVDATLRGETHFAKHFSSDNGKFLSAWSGREKYPALEIPAPDLAALKEISKGRVLESIVSEYVKKNPDEDQAETARYLMACLPDALVQMAERPDLAGSQRMLHVLSEYKDAPASGPTVQWFVDAALGRRSAP